MSRTNIGDTTTCAKRAQLPRLRDDVDDCWLAALADLDGPVKRRAQLS